MEKLLGLGVKAVGPVAGSDPDDPRTVQGDAVDFIVAEAEGILGVVEELAAVPGFRIQQVDALVLGPDPDLAFRILQHGADRQVWRYRFIAGIDHVKFEFLGDGIETAQTFTGAHPQAPVPSFAETAHLAGDQ